MQQSIDRNSSPESSMKSACRRVCNLALDPCVRPPGADAGRATDQPCQDPRLTTGDLDNGLRYIILPHSVPPGRV